jgi:hypothetical protein
LDDFLKIEVANCVREILITFEINRQ